MVVSTPVNPSDPLAVTVSVKARKVTVKGPKGEITKNLGHMAIDIRVMEMSTKLGGKGKYVRIQMWNGAYKHACAVTTFKSLISNMFVGVTEVSIVSSHFSASE